MCNFEKHPVAQSLGYEACIELLDLEWRGHPHEPEERNFPKSETDLDCNPEGLVCFIHLDSRQSGISMYEGESRFSE